MNLNDYTWLVQVVYLLIPVLVAVVFQRLYPLIKAKYMASTNEEQRKVIAAVARTVVLAVEGYMRSEPGQAKLREAATKVNSVLASRGIHATADEVLLHIEAAVYDELNYGRKDGEEPLDTKPILR